MRVAAPKDTSLTREAIVKWIHDYLQRALDLKREAIDEDAYFSDYGVDSMFAVVMTGDIREWIKKDISPTALYEHPTVNRLADHVAHLAGVTALHVERGR
jgi:acyl carrier protein